MLLGANLAGVAFSNAPVAGVHALAYPLGGIHQRKVGNRPAVAARGFGEEDREMPGHALDGQGFEPGGVVTKPGDDRLFRLEDLELEHLPSFKVETQVTACTHNPARPARASFPRRSTAWR